MSGSNDISTAQDTTLEDVEPIEPLEDAINFTRVDGEGEQVADTEMADTFKYMSNLSKIHIPNTTEFKRQKVIDAFQHSFELIGGVPRLAAWAHHNPTEFFKLYSKLLPSQSILDFGGKDGILRIVHSIAPGPLDTSTDELRDKGRVIEHDQPQQ